MPIRSVSGPRGIGTSRCACWPSLSRGDPCQPGKTRAAQGGPSGLLRSVVLPLSTAGDPWAAGRDHAAAARWVVAAAIARAWWRQVHQTRAMISHYHRRGNPTPTGSRYVVQMGCGPWLVADGHGVIVVIGVGVRVDLSKSGGGRLNGSSKDLGRHWVSPTPSNEAPFTAAAVNPRTSYRRAAEAWRCLSFERPVELLFLAS